ncbi:MULTISPECIES: MFS transporter [unclassified Pseudomonas]|uniref:MFS transporter n=1 Tax=unclassified Pseudomonas TaxID=196821 RepID=UPI0008770758|nr:MULTISPECIES: MFS transporter [unclassified Pseudomonas]SCZ75030.1 drug resistance transporter, EmrB/QacA subfamily [Pseudomonas sp. NFPP17]SDA86422.1 drug resistance transporter, EmrB/QacA subfamily [Pseudomonas sp. NFPP15]SEL92551.1 drug resistance transporter, EmrB/QacA subfamily [Pseudomonas sp. NFPP18]SFA67401.1 drug resistance transporter, EmrB/QacA subfamily [Pseudomonas sp. NFPP13]SFU09059.1 drug resistance transporter, EmrB/QacA subfamily [Pseudomonas sp. NFPP25]
MPIPESQATPQEALAPRARRALASLSLAMLMPSLDTSIANAALPSLAQTLEASFQQVQWIVLAYLLAITTLIASAGRLGDQWGRRRALLAGIALFTLASLCCGLAPGLGWLLAARTLQGLGAAVMLALSMALVGDALPKARTGAAMGWLGSMSALGTTLGPALGGLILASVGWRWMFLVNVPLGLVALLLAWRCLPPDRPVASASAFDVPGSLLLALSLGAYALALTLGHNLLAPLNLGLLVASVVGVALLVRVERRAAAPLFQPALLRRPQLRSSLWLSLLVSTVIMTTLVVGPFYLARGLGLGSLAVGLSLSLGPLVATLCGAPAGRLVDRYGARPLSRLGLLGLCGGLGLLALLPRSLGLAGYLLPLALVTASYALFQTANNSLVMRDVAPQQRGLTAGLLSLSRNLGLISGAAAMGALFAWGSGPQAGVEAVSRGMHWTFGVAALLMLLALLSAGRNRLSEEAGSPFISRLLAHKPTYMILDDHEIEDN